MARYTGSVCRICRRENMKLYLKGDRCYSDKCAYERRSYPPGQHGQGRGKLSGYGLQLREKQKIRRMYGILENQFKLYFKESDRQKGITGINLLVLMERRLDNTVYRLGFASSRAQARQLVRHGHFRINGKKVNIPSFLVKAGDTVAVRDRSQKSVTIQHAMEEVKGRGVPEWLQMQAEKFEGRVVSLPTRAMINLPFNEQLIVELYSK